MRHDSFSPVFFEFFVLSLTAEPRPWAFLGIGFRFACSSLGFFPCLPGSRVESKVQRAIWLADTWVCMESCVLLFPFFPFSGRAFYRRFLGALGNAYLLSKKKEALQL